SVKKVRYKKISAATMLNTNLYRLSSSRIDSIPRPQWRNLHSILGQHKIPPPPFEATINFFLPGSTCSIVSRYNRVSVGPGAIREASDRMAKRLESPSSRLVGLAL